MVQSVRIVSAAAAMLALVTFMSPSHTQAGADSEVVSSPSAVINLTTFQAASVVIGQPDFTVGDVNQGLANPAANTISSPFGNVSVSPTGVLYLSDTFNNRVLGFNTIPSSNNASADFVLGQPDFTSTGKGTAANQFGEPQTTVAFKSKLLVDDFFDNRVVIWKTAPTSNQVAANVVIGQTGFGKDNTSCTARTLSAPETISVGGGKLVVADSSNARVLIYNKIPRTNNQPADIVLGQRNFKTCVPLNDGTGTSGAPSAKNFSYPAGVWTDGKRLVVTDEDESRVLIWKTFPTKNFQKASVVLGQPDFTSSAVNNNGSNASGPPSASNMNQPYDGVFSNGTQLFVDDQKNQRILVWNTFPTTNFAAADVVLGQPNFTCGVESNDGTGCTKGAPSAKNLDNPTGVTQINNQLIVTDGNSRFLIFDGN